MQTAKKMERACLPAKAGMTKIIMMILMVIGPDRYRKINQRKSA